MKGFTHLAELYGVRCYYNENTQEVKGVNWLNDTIIEFLVSLTEFMGISFYDGFPIKIIREL